MHELLALQLCILLLETPTDDSVETVVTFVTECGAALAEVSPQALNSIFERLRSILHEGAIDKRVQYMIEGLYAVRKSNFADYPAVLPELDLVEAEDQITHEVSLDEQLDLEETLDYFTFDPDFEAQRTHHTPRAPPPPRQPASPLFPHHPRDLNPPWVRSPGGMVRSSPRPHEPSNFRPEIFNPLVCR